MNTDQTAVNCQSAALLDRWVQTCAVWIRDDMENPYSYYRAALAHFKANNTLPIGDLASPHTLLLSVEGGHVLQGDPDRVEDLFQDGIGTMSLTWNGENELAGGADSAVGLKPAGKEVIRKMNRLFMACDLSHLNDRSFSDAAELADFPVATHSNSRAVCGHKRNLTDDQLRIVRDKHGLVGLNFYPLFLGDGSPCENLFAHITHMLTLGLEDNLAIGSDFDGADMDVTLDGPDKIPKLYHDLSKMGIEDGLLDKIFYQNARNFYQKLFDNRHGLL